MDPKSMPSGKTYYRKPRKDPPTSTSSPNSSQFDNVPQQHVFPHVLNYAQYLPMPNVNSLVYGTTTFPVPGPCPPYESRKQNNSVENDELKATMLSLENAFQKFGNDLKKLNSTIKDTQVKRKTTKKNTQTNPTGTSQAIQKPPLSNKCLIKPKRVPLLANPSKNKKCQETLNSSEFSALPVRLKNSQSNSRSNKIKSSLSFESNKRDQENNVKSSMEALLPNYTNRDSEERGKCGDSVCLKDQQNSKEKSQRKQSSKPTRNHSASINKSTLGENSCHPRSQQKLIKNKVPQGDLNKDGEKSKTWKLYVIINENIGITQSLSKQLSERLKHKIKFDAKSVTKDKITGYVRFLLEFKNKHQMNMAMNLFKSSNKKNSIKIDCERITKENLLQGKQKTLEDKLKCQNEVIQEHEQKIESVRKEITSLMCSVGTTFTLKETIASNMIAYEHKERELLCQLLEYKKAENHLQIQMKTLPKNEREDLVEKEKISKKLDQEKKFLSKEMPLYGIRTEITETVLKNKVTILMGKCGSGKSTQLVQYLIETSLVDDGPIVCSEPSEKQALSMAKYVAAEVKSPLGNLVGFSSENDIHLGIYTTILYMSEHELLEQFKKINSFSAYSCIIIDEAQERTVHADLLLGLLKQELKKLPRLRLVILTAPADISIYQSFFTDSVLLEVSACPFPVQVIWSPPDQEDHTECLKKPAVEKALAVHCTEAEGDILVFVPSATEALECCTDFKSNLKEDNYMCHSLHGGLNYEQLKGIYKPLPLRKRKIIFTTDCAEVMMAIPNVRYVIDTGKQKEKYLESENKTELPISFITQESAKRRKERAGSSIGGKCYRLYSSDDFKDLETVQPNEMSLAGSIEKAVMNLINQEIDPMKFEFPTHVQKERISHTIKHLESLGAVFNDSGKYKLTDLGTKMSKLPFRFQITWMLLEGIKQGMIMESIALASLSDLKQEVFCIKSNETIQMEHQQFGQPCDSIALRTLKVLTAWFQQPDNKRSSWCAENLLNIKSIRLITSYMKDLCKVLTTKFKMNVKFSPKLSITKINDLEKLLKETLTKFDSRIDV